MSKEAVRQPLSVRTKSRRRLEERLSLRFPRLFAGATRAMLRLPPSSRLRQAILRRVVRQGMEAVNRGDYEAAFGLHDRDVELKSPPDMIGLGEASVTRGREERVRFQEAWDAQWGDVRFEPEELIDLGDRVLVIGRVRGTGISSGAPFDSEWANLLTLSAGRVIHERVFMAHHEALEVAGLAD
jgi:ketosteroid isomerase-like protein